MWRFTGWSLECPVRQRPNQVLKHFCNRHHHRCPLSEGPTNIFGHRPLPPSLPPSHPNWWLTLCLARSRSIRPVRACECRTTNPATQSFPGWFCAKGSPQAAVQDYRLPTSGRLSACPIYEIMESWIGIPLRFTQLIAVDFTPNRFTRIHPSLRSERFVWAVFYGCLMSHDAQINKIFARRLRRCGGHSKKETSRYDVRTEGRRKGGVKISKICGQSGHQGLGNPQSGRIFQNFVDVS